MNRCIVCGRVLGERILTLDNMPFAAQHMPGIDDLKTEKGITLSLYECSGCGLVQFDAPPVWYYRDVIRSTKVSALFRKLRSEQYAHFIEVFGLQNKRILEVGCGAGEFVEIFNDFPVKAYGVEHNKELIAKAKESGLSVFEGFIESENDILPDGPYDAFTSFNFLEHQPNPGGMLRGIYENLTDDGVGLITVPSFEYFQEQASYYEFIRDHIAYYTEKSLKVLLEMNGFEIVELKRFNRDTLEAMVRKSKKNSLVDFEAQKIEMQRKLNECLQSYEGTDKEVYIWGASHQGFTILSTLDFPVKLSGIIDSAIFKWNKYSPASHIPIISPEILREKTPHCIIIIAPAFSEEIFNTITKLNPGVSEIYTIVDSKIIKLK